MLRKISTSLKGAARLADRRHRSRDIVLPGLKDAAEIAYDAHGIPFITAWSQTDLFEVQGFACATDRLFQLIYLKHVAAGRIAELVGDRPLEWRDLSIHFRDKTVVDLDCFLRCLGLARAAADSLKALSRDTVVALEAYARGVNAAIVDQKKRGLPPEFVLLGIDPEPWSPVDSVSVLKLLAFQLNYSWRNILMLDHLSKRLSPEKARVLMPHVHPDSIPIIHGPSRAPDSPNDGGGATGDIDSHRHSGGNGSDVAADLVGLDAALRDATGLGGPGQGSNCWVVSGALTDTGHAFLCNDPHLPTTVPGPWFSVRLKGGGIDVTGAAIPGLPGVLIGHNRDVAWGITLTCADDGDVYVERTDPEHPNKYRVGENEWRDMTVRDEEIRVKGRGSVRRTVRETHHGPVISDILTTARAEGEVYAFRWTALTPTRELDGALPAMRARTGDEVIAALRHGNGAPALNVSYADRAGNIGYGLVGLIPIRRGWKGTTPVPGFDGSREWEGFVPSDELPTFKNPASGYVVTANHRVTDEHYPYYISDFFEPHHRHRRIASVLAEKSARGKLTMADMEALQADSHSLWAHGLVADVIVPWIKEARPVDPDLLWAAHELETWDGTATSGSRAATVFYPFVRHLVHLLLKEDLSAGLINIFLEATNLPVIPIVELLSNRSNPFWRGKDRNLIFHRALLSTIYELRARLGRDRSKWTWGRLHQLWLKHPLHAARPMRPLFSVGPFEGSGDGMTVNCGYMSHAYGFGVVVAPSMRFIADVGDWSRSKAVTLAGQSGRPQSRHYRDQTALWRAHKYRAVPFDVKSKGAVVTIRPTKR